MTRASEILNTALNLVTEAFKFTNVRVAKNQLRPIKSTDPIVSIGMGSDVVQSQSLSHIDWALDVVFSVGVFGAEEQIDDALLIIRNTIHKTIMGDYTLGLDFVINTEAGDVEAPAVDIDGDVPGATMDIVFVVSYRTPYTHLGVK